MHTTAVRNRMRSDNCQMISNEFKSIVSWRTVPICDISVHIDITPTVFAKKSIFLDKYY